MHDHGVAGSWRQGLSIPAAMTAALLGAIVQPGIARADTRAPLTPWRAAQYPAGAHYEPLCPRPNARGQRCYGQVLVDGSGRPIEDATAPPGGWTPGELETAYGLPSTGGENTVIAVYIGSHYTNAESDIATYRSNFGMTACTSANGCFTQITDSGGTDFSGLTDDGCSGFVGEESLDVDMLMAGCPNCRILVIEGSDHAAALTTASQRGAVSMSMSWGYGASASDCDGVWVPPAGLALFGASGDTGYTASPGAPAACANVVAVGWTQLATDSSPRGYADTLPSGWGSAGGCDTTIDKPSWETDTGCTSRMVSDVSANGDDVAAYCTSPNGSSNWHVTGGSSAASPFTSAVFAHLGITGGNFAPAWLYANEGRFWDVTSGGPVQNCPSGSPAYYCSAIPGYDGPTGVGTPYAPVLAGGDAGAGCATPGGSYLQTCTGCAAGATGAACVLTCASCTKIDGSQNASPTLTLPCDGTIANDDGALVCIPAPDAGSATDGGGPGGAGADASADATTAPPGLDGGAVDGSGAGADGGGLLAGSDAASAAAPDSGQWATTGAGSTNGSSGCGCSEAGRARSPSAFAAAALALGVAYRRRRKIRASRRAAHATT